MWTSQAKPLTNNTLKFVIHDQGQCLDYAQVIHLWQKNQAFRAFFIHLIRDVPFAAYFWETPSVSLTTVNRPFEFVLVQSPTLATKQADIAAFSGYFSAANQDTSVVTFTNLGKDATLVVPCPEVISSAYTHLANFSRQAPMNQQHSLWKQVGNMLAQLLNAQPIWANTSGLGVSWLHMRIDSFPKYYTYAPYRRAEKE